MIQNKMEGIALGGFCDEEGHHEDEGNASDDFSTPPTSGLEYLRRVQ